MSEAKGRAVSTIYFMYFLPIKTKTLETGVKLIETLRTALKKIRLREGDILIISSKVVALSQGRIVNLNTIKPGAAACALKRTRYGKRREDPRVIELILQEADAILPGKMLLALKDNILLPAAGIDFSNAPENCVILPPKNPWQEVRALAKNLKKTFNIQKLGILICDSHCQPLRWGTTGVALAWAGFFGIENAYGKKDIYGKKLRHTKKAVADNLASAALLLMGEAGEKIPMVIARNAPIKFTNRAQKPNETFMKPKECLFGGIYNKETISKLKEAIGNKQQY